MQKLDKMLEIRRRNAELLSKLLIASSEKYKVRIPEETADKKFNWYLYTVALQDDRDKIKNKLVQNNVGATVYYSPPVHKMPFYAHIASEAKAALRQNGVPTMCSHCQYIHKSQKQM